MSENYTQLPEHIRENLKKFNSHRQVTCLECGYIGLMGVNNSKMASLIFFAFLAGACISLVFLGVSFYVVFFVAFFTIIFKKIIFGDNVVCPNCDCDLKVR